MGVEDFLKSKKDIIGSELNLFEEEATKYKQLNKSWKTFEKVIKEKRKVFDIFAQEYLDNKRKTDPEAYLTGEERDMIFAEFKKISKELQKKYFK